MQRQKMRRAIKSPWEPDYATSWCLPEAPVLDQRPWAIALGVIDTAASTIRNGSRIETVGPPERFLWQYVRKPVPYTVIGRVMNKSDDGAILHAAWQHLQEVGLIVPWPMQEWDAEHWATTLVVRWQGPAATPPTARYADISPWLSDLAKADGQSVAKTLTLLRTNQSRSGHWWDLPWSPALRAARELGWLEWEVSGLLSNVSRLH